MALLGKAAVVIWVDMDAGMLDQHDVWHSAEHLLERMGVPGSHLLRKGAADGAIAAAYTVSHVMTSLHHR